MPIHVDDFLRDSTEDMAATKIISRDHGYAKTLQAVEASLPKIGGGERLPEELHGRSEPYLVGYIDLFLIHDPYAGEIRRLETYKALLECRDAGKIRSVGVSN